MGGWGKEPNYERDKEAVVSNENSYLTKNKPDASPLTYVVPAGTMSFEDRLDTWKDRWNRGATGWHQSDINFALENHASKLLPKPKCRVLVPLCGKTVDLEWWVFVIR